MPLETKTLLAPVVIPVEHLSNPWPTQNGVQTFIARLDKLHPHYGGNKWFKLKYNLKRAADEGYVSLITFGGAYSNHLYATAAAASEFGFKLICVIRGERVEPLNAVLQFIASTGAVLHFVSRSDYACKDQPEFLQLLLKRFGPSYIIPEGGANAEGVIGSSEITTGLSMNFDTLICACGTFTTLAGISLTLQPHHTAIGVNVLKAPGYGQEQTNRLLDLTRAAYPGIAKSMTGVSIDDDYHFGGYARRSSELDSFMDWMENNCGVRTDFVYTAKALFAAKDLIDKNRIKPDSRVIVLYTGVQTPP